MALYRVGPLPDGALAASARFHAEDLPRVLALLDPPLQGEVSPRSGDGGVSPSPIGGHPSVSPDGLPPPLVGEDLTIVFLPADHTHRAWRLAVVQQLAREHAPARVNALESDDETAIAAALSYLGAAGGVTGQLLPLDGEGAGEILSIA